MTQYPEIVKESDQAPQVRRWGQYWSRSIAILILINVLFSLFNLSYVPLRSLYLRYSPVVVQLYDPIKGIEPHPITQDYLQTIGQLRSRISGEGLESEAIPELLQELRQKSNTLFEENPFQDGRQGVFFSRLKRRVRQEMLTNFAQEGLQEIWQLDYIFSNSWDSVNRFLKTEIEPLLAKTYYRESLSTGQPIDDFWRFDLFFIVFFGGELLVRTFLLSRRVPDISWGDALARRWYEIPLLLPFWRWLRIIPAAVRSHRSQLLDVEKLLGQMTHEPAAYLSDRVSKYLIVRLINETQAFVRDGAFLEVLENNPNYTTVGQPEKIDQITDRLVQLIVMRVMPTVKPDIEQLLRHSLQRALSESEVYSSLSQIPGLSLLPDEALDGLAEYLSQATCDVLTSSYADEEGKIILDQLSGDFRQALGNELRNKADSDELKSLIGDVLEEFKVNYVERSHHTDPKSTLQEVDQLYQRTL